MTSPSERIRRLAIAAKGSEFTVASTALADEHGAVRSAALGALADHDRLEHPALQRAFADADPRVRRRAAEVSARLPDPLVVALLRDPDPFVVEAAAWAIGEGGAAGAPTALPELADRARTHPEAFVREAAVAALGALADPAGLPTILAAMDDVVTVRRRAVLALAPFEGDAVEDALARAQDDRDWQVRNAATDLREPRGGVTEPADERP